MSAIAEIAERIGPMTKRNDVNVRVDSEVATDAKLVANLRGTTLAEYVSELLRPLVRQDLEDEMAKRMKRAAGPQSRTRKPKGSPE